MNNKFIEDIARYVIKYASMYDIRVHSAIIAQAILESASGESELAAKANNYFGLKYRAGRCKTSNGIYHKVGSEQNSDGSYTNSKMKWFSFSNMEAGVIGYFDFINIPNYKKLKGVMDPEQYLKYIKEAGYATSIEYVKNVMNVIKKYGLTKYDNYNQNSSLVDYVKLSPNCSKPRNKKIQKITIHHMAGNLSVETCGNVFSRKQRYASSNYGIGTDGRVGLYVDEENRSWCSSSPENDHQAITIEVANDVIGKDWHISDIAFDKLILLCVDICKRNGIKKLNYTGDKTGNLTMHKWFAATACPGPYLESRFEDIASLVNEHLGVKGNIEIEEDKELRSLQDIAKEVIAGKWGNGSERKQLLSQAGYDYSKVQKKVNELLK